MIQASQPATNSFDYCAVLVAKSVAIFFAVIITLFAGIALYGFFDYLWALPK